MIQVLKKFDINYIQADTRMRVLFSIPFPLLKLLHNKRENSIFVVRLLIFK